MLRASDKRVLVAYEEAQKKFAELEAEGRQVQAQRAAARRHQLTAQLTLQQLNEIGTEHRLYEQIGHAYALTDSQVVLSSLEATEKQNAARVAALTRQYNELDSQAPEAYNRLQKAASAVEALFAKAQAAQNASQGH